MTEERQSFMTVVFYGIYYFFNVRIWPEAVFVNVVVA